MRLKKVEFKNYKSISKGILDIERDITCLVGVNESGKSNILLALEKADTSNEFSINEYSRHTKDYGTDENSPEIKLWFEVIKNEEKKIKELLGLPEVSIIVLIKKGEFYSLEFPNIDYENCQYGVKDLNNISEEEENIITEEDEEESNNLNKQEIRETIISELEDYIPRFIRFDSVNFDEYFLPENGEVSISKFISDPDAMKPIKNLLTLGGITDYGILKATNENERIRRDKLLNDANKKINKEILRVVWPIESVEIEISGESDILKIRLKEKGKTSPFKPSERSRGLQWALAFNIFFLAETKEELKESVLLIDEPGIFLHITAQNKLLEETFLKVVLEGNQIVYTTHLPYLIDSRFPERIRVLEKKDEDTIIGNKAWAEGEFGKIPEPVRTALGLRWSELLKLDENNVIVEGPSDQIILRSLQSILQVNKDINYLPAYGYEKFPSVLANSKIEGKQAFGLLDGDADIDTIRNRCKIISIPEGQIDTITNLVEDKQITTIEDVVPEDIFKKAVFSVYKPECERRRNCSLTIEELPIEYPRVSNLETFFAGKFLAKKHKLFKMEIARSINNIFKETDFNSKLDNSWGISMNLLKQIENRFQLDKNIQNLNQ